MNHAQLHQQAIEEHEIQIHHCKLRTWSLLHMRLLVLVLVGALALALVPCFHGDRGGHVCRNELHRPTR